MVNEICKYKELCGGCTYQGVPYEQQVAEKEKEVLGYLEKKKIRVGEYLGFEGSPVISAYRNKMEYTFGNMERGGEMQLGMHKKGQYLSILNIDGCQLVDPDFSRIEMAVLEFCREKGYTFYHKKSHVGLMRNLVIRKGERTGELLINIVTASGDKILETDFDEEGFCSMLRGLEPELNSEIVGILRTINDDPSDKVTAEQLKILEGRDYYNEEIMGLKFKVSAFSFFQTNIAAVERLYREAIGMVDDISGKTVYDLYCGTGTITQTLARSAKTAIGVEIVEDAVEAAKANAELNGLDNCQFIAGDVLKVLDGLNGAPEVIVVDPPRAGMNYRVLPKLTSRKPEQILYISCNPKTMVDNLAFFQENGYRIDKFKAYDNFPFTGHTESVAKLTRV